MANLVLETQKSILRCLGYFDMFSYPLLPAEIHRYMDISAEPADVENLLNELVSRGLVYCIDGYYLLHNNRKLMLKRCERNKRAEQLLPVAYRIGKKLSLFPFVKAVGISGSLSKNCADKDADIDFFIITKANRLWIARTLLHCLKKFSFLTGRQHWYCMNYFVDETALLMTEQNMFIAIELMTLKPVSGTAIQDMLAVNDWAADFLPNCPPRLLPVQENSRPWFTSIPEKLLDNPIGAYLDEKLMRFTQKRWQKKQRLGRCNAKGERMSLSVDRHYGKPSPGNFQQRIMDLYEAKCMSVESLLPQPVIPYAPFLRREMI